MHNASLKKKIHNVKKKQLNFTLRIKIHHPARVGYINPAGGGVGGGGGSIAAGALRARAYKRKEK